MHYWVVSATCDRCGIVVVDLAAAVGVTSWDYCHLVSKHFVASKHFEAVVAVVAHVDFVKLDHRRTGTVVHLQVVSILFDTSRILQVFPPYLSGQIR